MSKKNTNSGLKRLYSEDGSYKLAKPRSKKWKELTEQGFNVNRGEFGFNIKDTKKDDFKSFVPKEESDGSIIVTETDGFATGAFHSQYINFNPLAKTEFDLIKLYREMALTPEGDNAISDIVNEAIISDTMNQSVSITVDKVKASIGIKNKILEEFSNILELLEFNKEGPEIFRRWYVDARLYFHIIMDTSVKKGIQELRPIDAISIKKIKIQKKKRTVAGADVIEKEEDYFIYDPINKEGIPGTSPIKVAPEAIVYTHSGILDRDKKIVLSHLHKAIKPLNQLRMVEDATVIYRISRAPERRIFYIDVGNLPKGKAEQYVNNIMQRYKNKTVYNAVTGEVKDQRHHQSMLEDFFLPRREGGKGTEISTLQGGQNLGELADVDYFRRKLMKSLNVPVSRLETETAFNLGRAAEITRDEVKFSKFIARLRRRFSNLFNDLLKIQLTAKNIITEEDWNNFKEKIHYNFLEDSHFEELKDAEIWKERIGMVNEMNEFVGKFFSKKWVRKNVLKQTEEDIKIMDKEIEDERKAGEVPEPEDFTIAQLGGVPGQEEQPQEEPPQGDNFSPSNPTNGNGNGSGNENQKNTKQKSFL